MLLRNDTDEYVKVCMYNTDKDFDVVPLPGGMIFIDPNRSVTWQPSEKKDQVDVRFFHPQLVDRLLARAASVPVGQSVRLYKDSHSYHTDVTA